MDGPNEQKPHFVLVPLMAQGHTIPMIDMAYLLVGHGATVTFVTTPLNAARISTTIDHIEQAGLPIRFLPLKFPSAEAGLPEDCENFDTIPSRDLLINFVQACAMLREPLALHLGAQKPAPSCMISDAWHPWAQDVARELGIPRITFNGPGCFTLTCRHIFHHERILEGIVNENEPFAVPGLPHRIEITKLQAPQSFFAPAIDKFRSDMMEAESTADGVVVNTFDELEPWYVEHFEKRVGKKVWTIGPVSLRSRNVADMAARGNKASVDERLCLSWLDSKGPSSVVYVSFGSLARTAPTQLMEVGLGLEASNCPFIWAIKAGDKSKEVEEWLSGGFEERTSGRGLIIRGWAPQVMILSHPAVGGFVTHGGWNSTLEGVSAGVPLVTWPHFADQFLSERLVVDVLRIGVAVGVKAPTRWGVESDEVLVKRDDVEKAVCQLMGEEGKEMRGRAREFGEKANKAMEKGGSSFENIKLLVHQFQKRD